jgi:hypothetical protein
MPTLYPVLFLLFLGALWLVGEIALFKITVGGWKR